MGRRLGPRFGAEAGLIAASAVLAVLLELDWPGVVATVFGTWLAIALFEVGWSRTRPAMTETPVPAELQPPAPPPPTPVAPQPPPVNAAPVVSAPGRQPAEPEAAPGRAPRSWNLWELERVARDVSGTDPAADQERQYTLLYLRDFADADGNLPIDFDPLVREVFGEKPVIAS